MFDSQKVVKITFLERKMRKEQELVYNSMWCIHLVTKTKKMSDVIIDDNMIEQKKYK